MFANFTEETCTGTGATLALAGALTDRIPFAASFSDGDLVAYVLEDSGGTIKVAGIGTYVSATDDITRNDTWNWNGVAVDENPAANITLSGGTHTVRCDVIDERLLGGVQPSLWMSYHVPDNIIAHRAANTPTADRMYYGVALFLTPTVITNMIIDVSTLDAAATNTRQGIYAMGSDGDIGDLLADSGNINVSTTGVKTTALGTPLKLPAGKYFFTFVTDSTVLRVRGPNMSSMLFGGGGGITPFSGDGRFRFGYISGVTGALPTSPTRSGSIELGVMPMGFS